MNIFHKATKKISDTKTEQAKKLAENKKSQNIFNMLGIGIVSYFSLLEYLIVLFIVFTIISFPMIYIYRDYDGMKGTLNGDITKSTLGNMGFSSST